MLDVLFSATKKIIPERWHHILEHAGFRKYFANTGWMFFGQIFSMGISFFIGAWLARYLGPKNYGIINYAFSFVGIFTFIANLGIGTILFRDLAKYPEKRDVLLGTSFRLLLFGGGTAFILVAVSAFVFETSGIVRGLIILYATTFIWSVFNIIQTFFQAAVKAKKNVYAAIITGVVSSILKVGLIVFHKGIIWLMLIFVLESLFSSFLVVSTYWRSGYRLSAWTFDWKTAKNILSGSWMVMLATSASFLLLKVDQVMIEKYLGEHAVGLYAAAVRLVEVWYFVPSMICSSLFPAVINAKGVDEVKYHKRIRYLYFLLGLIGLLIAIPSTVLAPWVINLLFGKAYAASSGILRIYVWSGIGLFIMWGMQQYYLAENRLKMTFYLYLFSTVVNIVLNLFFIPKFGLTGAAWATLIAYCVGPIAAFIAINISKIPNLLRSLRYS